MKRLILLVIVLLALTPLCQAGDMAHSGSWGVQTSLGVAAVLGNFPSVQSLGAKFYVSHNIAIRVEAGFSSFSPAGTGGSSSGYSFGGGFEYHFASPGGNVSPYLALEGGFGGGSTPTNNLPVGATVPPSPTQISVKAAFGGEYFFSGNFSAAGEIGGLFMTLSNQPLGTFPQTYGSSSTFGTVSASLILSWYLN